MPKRTEIAKMGGDDEKCDKDRIMADFLDGFVPALNLSTAADTSFQLYSSLGLD